MAQGRRGKPTPDEQRAARDVIHPEIVRPVDEGVDPDALDPDLVPGVGMPAVNPHHVHPVRPCRVRQGHVTLNVEGDGPTLLKPGDEANIHADPEALGARDIGWIEFLDEVDDRAQV